MLPPLASVNNSRHTKRMKTEIPDASTVIYAVNNYDV
jgi:hypothetical protein